MRNPRPVLTLVTSLLGLVALALAITVATAFVGHGLRPQLVASADPETVAPAASVPAAVAEPTPTAELSPGPTTPPEPIPDPGPEPTPDPVSLPTSGPGTFTAAAADGWRVGVQPGVRLSVAVEDGIGLDAEEVAAQVRSILGDPRSWTADGETGFELVDTGADIALVVASPATVDRLCAPLITAGIYSCGTNGYVAINLIRWMTATDTWPADLTTYREYLVNHEVGHYLRGPAHPGCPGTDQLAPVMMQQSKGLDGCRPNGWPYPHR